MSTPSESPELVEISDYLPRHLREQLSSETEHPIASENDPSRSPYAPKPAAERAAARLRRLAKDQSDQPPQPQPSEIRRRILADQELARIEASLRQLQQQQGTDMRLPRGPNLPLPGPSSSEPASREADARVLEWLSRPRPPEPTIMPPPPREPARKLRMSLVLALACFGGAAIGYAFLPERPLQSAADSEITAATSVAPPFRPRTSYYREASQLPSQADAQWQGSTTLSSGAQIELARTEPSEPDAQSPAAAISARHSLAKAELPDEESMASSAPASAAPVLKPEDIDVLIAQGERFMADGDVVTARLIFERAAKAGSATAALALAAAYDPIMLSKLGVLGVDTDVEKARRWYQKAESLGSDQAVERLRALAER